MATNEFEAQINKRGHPFFPESSRPSNSELRESFTDIFTGASRTRESDVGRQELPREVMQGGGVPAFRMAFARGDLGKLQILEKMLGQPVPNEMDKFGNIHVTIDGDLAERMKIDVGTYFINKPGISGQDIHDISVTGAIELFTTVGASKVLGVLGPAAKFVSAAFGAGGASIGQDVIAGQLGSQEGIDIKTALMATLFGGAGEGAAQMASTVWPFLSKFFKNKRFWSSADGGPQGITRDGIKVLERAGIPADRITPEFADKFEAAARGAVDPVHAARVAEAASLPGPDVPVSRGGVSRNPVHQAEEDMYRKGQLGDAAQKIMKDFDETQGKALAENVEAIQDKIGGAGVPRLGGMDLLQTKLRSMRRDLHGRMDTAYDIAGNSGTSFDVGTISAFHDHVRSRMLDVADDIVLESKSFLSMRLKELDEMAFRQGDSTFTQPLKEIDVGRLYKWRSKISTRRRQEFGTPQAHALGNLLGEFDSFMEGAIDNALFRGSDKGIQQWKKAIMLRRSLAKTFESDNIVSKLIEILPGDGSYSLRFEPSEALNFLFGANNIGAKTGATNALRKIKKIVGEESEEWLGLKEEGVMRLFQNALKEIDGKPVFSGAKFRTDLDNAMYKAPELMKELFSSSDLALLQHMKRVASTATEKVAGALNPSGTAGRLAMLADRLFGTGPARRATSAAYQKFMNNLSEFASRSGARRATTIPVEPIRKGIPFGVGSAVGGTIAQKRRRSPGLLGEEYKAWKVRGPQMMTR